MKNITYIFFVLVLISFISGIYFGNINYGVDSYGISKVSPSKAFFQIFFQNILVATVLLLGILTYYVFTFCLVIYNFFNLGISLKHLILMYGFKETILLILPHSIFELSWLILIPIFSFTLYDSFLKLINSNFNDFVIIKTVFSRKLFILYFLVLISSLIEAFITPIIFEQFK